MKELRILHIINSLHVGGAERLLSELLPLLKKEFSSVALLVLDAADDAYSAQLKKHNVELFFAGPEGKKTSPYNVTQLCKMCKLFRTYKPDIVHVHLAPSFHWAAFASVFFHSVTFVTTEHNTVNRRMNMPTLKLIEKFCYGRYKKIIAVHESVTVALKNWLGARLNAITIPNGINFAPITTAEAAPDILEWAGSRTVILMAARMVPQKDQSTLISALEFLPRGYCLVLAGDGEMRSQLEMQAQKLNLHDRVLFTGLRADMPALLAAADIYVQSSHHEGMSIALLEAMVARLPIIVSDIPGLYDVIDNGALAFRAGDARACAHTVQLVGDDANLQEQMRARLTNYVQNFSIDTVTKKYCELYSQLSEHAQ